MSRGESPTRAPRRAAPAGAGRSAGAVAKLATGAVAAGAAAAAYMAFEAQWIQCRQAELPVPGLPIQWSGLTVLHLADVHAGTFYTNERSLHKAVEWAAPLAPDLVLLTGDILGDPGSSSASLRLLAELKPKLGTFAVTGNHEYGIGKGPLARARDTRHLWQEAGITLLADECVTLPPRDGSTIVLCGADHITGGHGLDPRTVVTRQAPAGSAPKSWTPFGPRPIATDLCPEASASDPHQTGGPAPPLVPAAFPILLIHTPPPPDSPLGPLFRLTFAGHTHGGQLRLPTRSGIRPLHREDEQRLAGVHRWGAGLLVVSRGVGTSFLPFRLLTRPEATLWRLVYTFPEEPTAAEL